jgi:diguanylate cyclase (GGDEF)-like protein
MHSLRFKILAVAAMLVLLTQAGTVTTVLITANRDISARAQRALEAGARVFEQTSAARATQLGNTVSVLAADYAFKQAVASHDSPTIESALANHARRAGADLALLLDDQGEALAATGPRLRDAHAPQAWVDRAMEAGLAHSALIDSDVAYEIFTVPVRAPLPIGWVAMGFAINDSYAQRVAELTGLRAAVLARVAGHPRVIARSPGVDDRVALEAALASSSAEELQTLDGGGAEHLAIAQRLAPGASDVTVILTESLEAAMAPYRLLRTAAIVLGALPLLLGLAGAVLLSRTLTRPVQALAAAARRMKVGDYSQVVEVHSGDELAELAVAFNAMQEGIARREQQITYQARHDTLTALPNRDHALEWLDAAIGRADLRQQAVAVMVMDLQGLTEIGTSFGHDVADAFIRQAAEQLRGSIDREHMVARLEGDSFLIGMESVDAGGASDLAERLVGQLARGMSLRNFHVNVRPAIGIAVFPEHGTTHDQLLLRANVARSDSRISSRAIGIYHAGDEERRVRQFTILSDLRRAVRGEELKLHFQPKIRVSDRVVCGAEALVRWAHPSLGWVPPAEFVPIAEHSGNIGVLTHWALTAAARQCRLWLEEDLDLPVSVNLSGQDLQNHELPWFVMDVLRNHDLPSRYLIVEITEEAVVQDVEHASQVLQRLRDLGIRISIDDFGTGYSSLGQLKHLPADELKIDRSFVTQLPDHRADAAIVRAAVDLAHHLGLEFVAEGVETHVALEWLREIGCDRAQGFLISRPLPADLFGDWVRTYSGGATRRMPIIQAG